MQQQPSQSASDERSDYGHDCIAPIRGPLVRDWQYRVCKPRPQVSSGIDRVTSRSTKRQADTPNQGCNQIGAQTRYQAGPSDCFGKHGAYHKDQQESPYNFAYQVRNELANGGYSAEAEQFEI